MNFAFIVWNSSASCSYYYNGPQFEVQKIVTAAAGQGSVLSIDAPLNQPNASYTQSFAGPALQCSDVRDSLRGQILSNVNTSIWGSDTSFGYLAWVPTESSPLPFELISSSSESGTWQLRADTIDPTANAPLTLFVATFPNFIAPYWPGVLIPGWDYTANATIIQCSLMNGTYLSSHNWTNGIQDLELAVTVSDNNITYPRDIDCPDYLFKDGSPPSLLTGGAGFVAPPPSEYDNTRIQNFAYASVMDAFVKLVKGSLYNPLDNNGLLTSTNVMSTMLGNTKELLAVQNRMATGMESFALLGEGFYPAVSVKMPVDSTYTLRTTLEKVFQNVTMSLMSSPLLQ